MKMVDAFGAGVSVSRRSLSEGCEARGDEGLRIRYTAVRGMRIPKCDVMKKVNVSDGRSADFSFRYIINDLMAALVYTRADLFVMIR